MPRIYTRTGDSGETGLLGGGRVPKAHPRIETCGELDELNAAIGWAATQVQGEGHAERLGKVQEHLFGFGSHLAAPPPRTGRRGPRPPPIMAGQAEELEAWIDRLTAQLPPLKNFILPGGSPGGAALHLARAICRRAERRVVALAQNEYVDPNIIVFLNRLSDLLFTLARFENALALAPERIWVSRPSDPD